MRMLKPEVRELVDISQSQAARASRADMMLERARWAAEVFHRYDRELTLKIADAVARVAHEKAGFYADWAVRETGFGVAEHKKIKNEMTSIPFVDGYRERDFVSPRILEKKKIIEIPRPAGVVFGLIPSTNPIATVNFKTLLALLTRNAIILSPHPAARECCIDAARTLAAAAEEAGAPEAAIQIVEEPTIPLIEEFMGSPKLGVILATGGTAMVRAAYSSSSPAIGVGPGNAPVFVDESADIRKAASRIVDSKSFDNSVLCTSESVLLTTDAVEPKLSRELSRAGAYICKPEEVVALRRYLFHERGFNVEAVGRDASWICSQIGIRAPAKTRILVAPIDAIGVEEPLSREKLCPVLAYYTAAGRAQAISQSRAVLRLAGAGHSAAIHARDEATILAFSETVEAYRVVVNAPTSQGAAGFATHLAPTFTVGTGFFGRSSIGENINPEHLLHWTRIAYNADADEPMGNYAGLSLSQEGPLPEAPADGVPGSTRVENTSEIDDELRNELRRLIVEELRAALRK
ncbi:MAG: aldehyde dehydrogenase family protein [Hyphomicrobiales bacterium]|nr:aldehyde dehydrogenase family protein [Hyphomicrobiales bacterium]